MSLEHSPAKGRRLVRPKEVMQRFGCSRVTLWRWVREGRFPAPLHPGPNFTAWTDDQIEDHIDDLIAARDADLAEGDAR